MPTELWKKCAVPLFVAVFGAVLAYLWMNGAFEDYLARRRSGLIYVDTPEIYTRERLVNDRFREDEWLSKMLDRATTALAALPPDAYQGTEATLRRDALAVAHGEVLPATASDGTQPAPQPGAGGSGPPRGDQAERQPPKLSVRPIDEFEDMSELRRVIREELLENQLDDRHDLGANTLLRLKFDASLIPEPESNAWGLIVVEAIPAFAEHDDSGAGPSALETIRSRLRSAMTALGVGSTKPAGLHEQCGRWNEVLPREECERAFNEIYTEWLGDAEKRVRTSLETAEGGPRTEALVAVAKRLREQAKALDIEQETDADVARLLERSDRERMETMARSEACDAMRMAGAPGSPEAERRWRPRNISSPSPVSLAPGSDEAKPGGPWFPSRADSRSEEALADEGEGGHGLAQPPNAPQAPECVNAAAKSSRVVDDRVSETVDALIVSLVGRWNDRPRASMDAKYDNVAVIDDPQLKESSSGRLDPSPPAVKGGGPWKNLASSESKPSPLSNLKILNPPKTISPSQLRNWVLTSVFLDELRLSKVGNFAEFVSVGCEQGRCTIRVCPRRKGEGRFACEDDGAFFERERAWTPPDEFVKALTQSTQAFSYAVVPKTAAGRVFRSAEEGRRLQMALKGLLPGSADSRAVFGAGLERDLSSLSRVPMIVGFSDGWVGSKVERESDPGRPTTRFGWFVGPAFGASHLRHGEEQQAQQVSLSALISVPGWWNRLSLRVRKCWVARPVPVDQVLDDRSFLDHCTEGVGNEDEKPYVVDLPFDARAVSRAFDFIIPREPYMTGVTRGGVTLVTGTPGTLLIRGQRLWRSTRVTLGAQAADSIEVLPNMEGILATFRCIQVPTTYSDPPSPRFKGASVSVPQYPDEEPASVEYTIPVTVWTSEGVAEGVDVTVRRLTDGPRCDPISGDPSALTPEPKPTPAVAPSVSSYRQAREAVSRGQMSEAQFKQVADELERRREAEILEVESLFKARALTDRDHSRRLAEIEQRYLP